MRTLHGILFALIVALAACSTTASTGGGTATDDTTAADTALSDVTTAADTAGDTATALDAVDAKLGDATDGVDAIAKDVADGQSGGDTALTDLGVADSAQKDVTSDAPSPDSGPAPDVDTAICNAGCANIAAAHCPKDPTVAECVQSCIEFEVQFAALCSKEVAAYLKCASTAQVVCVDGSSDSSICAAESEVMSKCISGTGPSGCGAFTCGGGGGPGGMISCNCAGTCKGVDVKLDCDGTTCQCYYAGAKTAQFSQGGTCASDVTGVLQASCIPAP